MNFGSGRSFRPLWSSDAGSKSWILILWVQSNLARIPSDLHSKRRHRQRTKKKNSYMAPTIETSFCDLFTETFSLITLTEKILFLFFFSVRFSCHYRALPKRRLRGYDMIDSKYILNIMKKNWNTTLKSIRKESTAIFNI